jgi:hypothetical protein
MTLYEQVDPIAEKKELGPAPANPEQKILDVYPHLQTSTSWPKSMLSMMRWVASACQKPAAHGTQRFGRVAPVPPELATPAAMDAPRAALAKAVPPPGAPLALTPDAERNAFISALNRAERDGVPIAAVRAFCASRELPLADVAQEPWDRWSGELAQWHKQGEPPLSPRAGDQVEGGGCEITETALRGITLRQLRKIQIEASELCKTEGWMSFDAASESWTGPPIAPDALDLYALVHYWIKPQTAARKCSAVELVANGAQPPRTFVSHWWGEPVKDFIACLEVHVNDHQKLGVDEDTPYWVRAPAAFAPPCCFPSLARPCRPYIHTVLPPMHPLPWPSNLPCPSSPSPGPLPVATGPPARPWCRA